MGEILIGPARSLSSKKPEERVRCRNLNRDVKHYKSSVNAIWIQNYYPQSSLLMHSPPPPLTDSECKLCNL